MGRTDHVCRAPVGRGDALGGAAVDRRAVACAGVARRAGRDAHPRGRPELERRRDPGCGLAAARALRHPARHRAPHRVHTRARRSRGGRRHQRGARTRGLRAAPRRRARGRGQRGAHPRPGHDAARGVRSAHRHPRAWREPLQATRCVHAGGDAGARHGAGREPRLPHARVRRRRAVLARPAVERRIGSARGVTRRAGARSLEQVRLFFDDAIVQRLKAHEAGDRGAYLRAGEARHLGGDLDGHAGCIGEQLRPTRAIHGDEPERRRVDRCAHGEQTVVAQDQRLASSERLGDAIALAGVEHHAGVVVE